MVVKNDVIFDKPPPPSSAVIFNDFRYSVRFLDSYEILVYIIDTLSN